MNISIVILLCGLAILSASLLPLIDTYYWFVRALDFPRAQLMCLNLIYILIIFFRLPSNRIEIAGLILALIALSVDLYRVGPYLPFYPVEAQSSKTAGSAKGVKVLSYNVFIKNKNFKGLTDLVDNKKPDMVVLLETDLEWEAALKNWSHGFTYSKYLPRENTYGIVIYSNFEVIKTEVKYLVDKAVPSVFLDLMINGVESKLVVVHPRPPRPKEGTSLQRDGELAHLASILEEFKNRPVIVIGDFNDVAWSHTSRLFKRVARLKDPRIGRGFYNTFHTSYPIIRVPLDHIFHNDFFEVRTLEVLEDIGSDHYPIFGEFSLVSEKSKLKKENDEPTSEEDKKEIVETKKDSKYWKGPKKEDSEETE